jgi:hypothetical protein
MVSEQDADQIERTNDAISRLGLIWRGLSNQLAVAAAPALEAVANAMAAIASRTGPLGIAIRGLFDNIGRLTTYAATFAAFLAGRWVAGMAAAALSVRGLATALVVLRGALIRTGIGALIVGAGELVYQFTRLVSGAGGFGEAMSLLKDLAVEVWERIRMGAAAAGAAATAMFFDLKADAASGMQSAIESVVGFGNTAANTFEGAYEAIKAIWGLLPAAIGDLAFQAANSLVDGVEAMLNGVVSRINGFIGGINQGLGSARVRAAHLAGARPRPRRDREPLRGCGDRRDHRGADGVRPGLRGQPAHRARSRSDRRGEPGARVREPLSRRRARSGRRGSRAPRKLAGAARCRARHRRGRCRCADRGHRRGRAAGDGARRCRSRRDRCRRGGRCCCRCGGAQRPRRPSPGWQAVTAALSDYASKARDIGGDIGQSLVGAFQSAENAVGQFVRTGKLNFRDLVTSLLADLAQLAARRFILGPIANALSGVFSGAGVRGAYAAPLGPRSPLTYANVLHAGGMVGSAGPSRMVPAMAFAAAPRMHGGGMAGLRHDEVPAILQRGERVLSRREAQSYGAGGVNVTIMARDAESFRQSRTQVAADIARAVSLGRRGM